MRDPHVRIHGMAPALNYGQQAFEGLKAFRTSDNKIQIFRPDRNAARLQHSAECLSMPPVPINMFLEACKAAISLNAEFVPPHETGAAMYIRPQLYGSSAKLGLSPPEEYTFCVYVVPTGVYGGGNPLKALVLDQFDRAAPNGTGNAKVGGNYAPVMKWSDKARKEGYDITLHLDSATHSEVDEFSTSGFIGAIADKENVTLVVPDSKSVIESVTSDAIQHIGRSFGWSVEKRPVRQKPQVRRIVSSRSDRSPQQIKYGELPSFTEVMAAGTAVSLVPIRSITRNFDPSSPNSMTQLAKGNPRISSTDTQETVTYIPKEQKDAGPVHLKLLAQLMGIQLGKVKDEFGWCYHVSGDDGTNIAADKSSGAVNGQTADYLD